MMMALYVCIVLTASGFLLLAVKLALYAAGSDAHKAIRF